MKQSSLATQRRRGFSLTEIMVVISIVCLLMVLLAPALVSAKREAKVARSISQMRQIHAALMLYVEGESGDGPLGLGFPPSLTHLAQAESIPRAVLVTGGSTWKAPKDPDAVYTWMPPILAAGDQNHLTKWLEYVSQSNRNPVFLLDETFSPTTGLFSNKLARGIFYDGHIEKRWSQGYLSEYDLWK